MKIKSTLSYIGDRIERMNQVVLSVPLWLIIGVFGCFRSFENVGWIKSIENEDYGKMY